LLIAGISKDGKEVFLRDIWPTRGELQVWDWFYIHSIFYTVLLSDGHYTVAAKMLLPHLEANDIALC